jgi:DNA-binding MarR family transcriptional regulator
MSSAAARSEPLQNRARPDEVDHAIMRHFLDKPGFLLARIDQICTSLYGDLASGETLGQAELLLLSDALGAAPQVALARAAGIDSSTTAYVLANLADRNWVVRRADEGDRRRAVVALTAEGKARIGRITSDYARLQQSLLAPLDPSAREKLRTLLARIAVHEAGRAPIFTPTAGVLDGAPSLLCRRAHQLFQAQFIASTCAFNLTPRQFSLLFILTRIDSITQVRFARLFGLDPSTCAIIMRNLARRELLASAPSSDDRRALDYRLTRAGRDAVVGAAPLVDQSERLVFLDTSPADASWLVLQFQRIVHDHSHRLRFPGALSTDPPL